MSDVDLDIWFTSLNVSNILVASLMTWSLLLTTIWVSDNNNDENLDLDRVLLTTVNASSVISD